MLPLGTKTDALRCPLGVKLGQRQYFHAYGAAVSGALKFPSEFLSFPLCDECTTITSLSLYPYFLTTYFPVRNIWSCELSIQVTS